MKLCALPSEKKTDNTNAACFFANAIQKNTPRPATFVAPTVVHNRVTEHHICIQLLIVSNFSQENLFQMNFGKACQWRFKKRQDFP
jgi:hypothetical protein